MGSESLILASHGSYGFSTLRRAARHGPFTLAVVQKIKPHARAWRGT